jgi:GNAT superfamily N-acetyltransferase
MTCDYAIREAVRADVPELLRLIRALAEYEKLSHEVVADEARLEASLFGARPVASALLLESAGRCVGFAVYFRNYSTFRGRHGIYLEDLFVEEASRGRGYGRALLHAVACQALAEGCERLEWSVLDWNAPSIAFYKSLGARPLDDWTIFRMTREVLQQFAG